MGSARWFFDVFCGFSIPDRNIDAGFTNMSCQFWELNACKCSMHGAYGCRYWGRSLSWGCLLDLRVCFTMQWNLLSVLMFLFSGWNYNRILYTCLYGSIWIYMDLYGSIWIYMDIYNIYSYRIYIYDQDSLHSKGMSQTSKRLLSAQLRSFGAQRRPVMTGPWISGMSWIMKSRGSEESQTHGCTCRLPATVIDQHENTAFWIDVQAIDTDFILRQ